MAAASTEAVERRAARGRRAARVIVGLGAFLVLALVFVVVGAVRPTNVKKLAGERAPIEDRSARLAKPGCALTEVGAEGGACAPVHVSGVREEQVSFPSSIPEKGLASLNGTLSLPHANGPRPAIILLHGSGPNSRDEVVPGDLVSSVSPPMPVLARLADFFAREGLVVLRWDKRACLRCYPDFQVADLAKFRWSDYVQDAKDALAYLATRPEVDATSLVVAGHSEGAQLAPYVAEGDGRVVAVMMLAGLTEPYDEAFLAQLTRIGDIRLAQADLLGALNVRASRASYARCFAKLAGPHDPADMCTGGGVSLDMLADYVAYARRMPEVLKAQTAPIFAVQGTVDRNIDPDEMDKLRPLLAGKDFELHLVPGVSHLLVNAVSGDTKPEIDQDVERRMHAFLASVKR